MITWLRKIIVRSSSALSDRYSRKRRSHVDSGRDVFVKLKDKEHKQKQSLLRKLNLYRAKQKSRSQHSFAAEKSGLGWSRYLFLGICLALALVIFFETGGTDNIKSIAENLDFFRITSVEVEGCRQTTPEIIRNSAEVRLKSSILTLDKPAIANAIKEKNQWVRDVEIMRRWPDGIVIQIKEFEPQALIAVGYDNGAHLHYMDGSGEAFVKADENMELDVPVITGLEHVSDDLERIDKLAEALHFLRLIRANNPNLPAQSVSEINIDPEEGLVIHLVEYPFPVFFGHGEVRKKYYRLRKVLEVLYKPRKKGMDIAQVTYIRMGYLNDKVIVGYSESG